MSRIAVVTAPVGISGPVSRQNAGSSTLSNGPPDEGLPSTTKIRIETPIPIRPSADISASVTAPTAITQSAPISPSSRTEPPKSPIALPTAAPAKPTRTATTASAPSRQTVWRLPGRSPKIRPRNDAPR